MTAKQARRLAIDGGMLLLLILLMGQALTGGALHEWMGIALTALIGLHLYYNKAWLKALTKGKYRWRRTAGTVINALLLTSLLVLIIASLPISGTLFPWFPVRAQSMFPSQLHIAASNWFFLLAALHLGMQWPRVMPSLPKRLVSPTFLERLLGVGIAGYGLWAFFARNVHEKLVMYSAFDFSRLQADWLSFIVDYLALFFLFAHLGYYLLAQRKSSAKSKKK